MVNVEKYVVIFPTLIENKGHGRTVYYVDYDEVEAFRREFVKTKKLGKYFVYEKALKFAKKQAEKLGATLLI